MAEAPGGELMGYSEWGARAAATGNLWGARGCGVGARSVGVQVLPPGAVRLGVVPTELQTEMWPSRYAAL